MQTPEAPIPPSDLGRYRILSPTCGLRVSPLQFGAMSLGEAWGGPARFVNKKQSFKLLDTFFEAGGNFIDTANDYQNEQSEKFVGEWIAERKNRDQIVLATKYSLDYKSYELGKGKAVNHMGNHKRSMYMSVRDSLKKLQTEWIDILYVHIWEYTTSIEEVMNGLHELVMQGKILYLGISDTPAWIVSAANKYAVAHGKTPFCIYQGRWNAMTRDLERDIIPMCMHFGMAIAPYDVLNHGKFQSAKVIEERLSGGEGFRRGDDFSEREIKMNEVLAKVADEHGAVSVPGIAIAYVMAKAPYVFPILGSRKIENIEDNIKSLSIKLTPEQVAFIDGAVPFDFGFPINSFGLDPSFTGHPGAFLTRSIAMSVVKGPQAIGY
ncbi:NADP-dependent oxidoreductase domain-containing protein [Lipomyces oligophaga]|uniref:NADP-dependent oxidoreductase domain-containing protein n=1 Tax=Lipomyces oligophaga TaxID=45792 RepID=UPI0034CD5E3C